MSSNELITARCRN